MIRLNNDDRVRLEFFEFCRKFEEFQMQEIKSQFVFGLDVYDLSKDMRESYIESLDCDTFPQVLDFDCDN